MPLLSKEKEKKNDIKLRRTQVVPDVDQRGHVRPKSDYLSWNWLDVYFNLTKGITRYLLSKQISKYKTRQ